MTGRSATGKNDTALLRTIGEVAESLDLPQHVLRFWETRFKEIDPVKRAGGRRFYRPRDIELVAAIRHLLYREGYTIKGVQRILKEQGVDAVIDDVRKRQSGEGAAPRPAATSQQLVQPTLDLPEPEAPESVAQTCMAEPTPEEERDDEPAETAPQTAEPKDSPPPPVVGLPAVIESSFFRRLDEAQARALREALAEIEECKRLLNLTRR